MPTFPSLTATKLQAAAYLLGVALFSISFLVFLNASISFVVTDVIGRKHGVGNVVGTLGFADELVALVACPVWGLLSDKIGVRNVSVFGYLIIGVSLMLLVQSHNVYPQLLIARMGFSIGGAACSTMVTAILPAMTAERKKKDESPESAQTEEESARNNSIRHSAAFSISSEITITPARFTQRPHHQRRNSRKRRFASESPLPEQSSLSQLAGYVGMFTGIGALLAVAVFLPLPVNFSNKGTAKDDAVKYSFYVVGTISIVVSVLVFFGLRRLPGEEDKGLHKLIAFGTKDAEHDQSNNGAEAYRSSPSYYELIKSAVLLGFTDSRIALGYLGGFVARASSVGISLFIPLFINAYFIREGLCTNDPSEEIKSNCQRAYTLSSMLTGFSQLTALLCAPLFGWFSGYLSKKGQLSYLPLSIGAVSGIVGCVAFGRLDNPDPFHGSGGKGAILAVILLGFSQISAIVCSLGILARGIQASDPPHVPVANTEPLTNDQPEQPLTNGEADTVSESAPLITNNTSPSERPQIDRSQLKGTIAGVYSLAGGAGILLLTKLGGVLFDKKSPGAPFYMLAVFNAILLAAVMVVFILQRMQIGSRPS